MSVVSSSRHGAQQRGQIGTIEINEAALRVRPPQPLDQKVSRTRRKEVRSVNRSSVRGHACRLTGTLPARIVRCRYRTPELLLVEDLHQRHAVAPAVLFEVRPAR